MIIYMYMYVGSRNGDAGRRGVIRKTGIKSAHCELTLILKWRESRLDGSRVARCLKNPSWRFYFREMMEYDFNESEQSVYRLEKEEEKMKERKKKRKKNSRTRTISFETSKTAAKRR